MAPASEPNVNQVSFPVPFSVLACHWQDWGKHHLCTWSFNQSPQCPEVPFDGFWTAFCNLITANLYNQQWLIIRGPYQTKEFPSNVSNPGPREAEDFPVGWGVSTYFLPQNLRQLKFHCIFGLASLRTCQNYKYCRFYYIFRSNRHNSYLSWCQGKPWSIQPHWFLCISILNRFYILSMGRKRKKNLNLPVLT